MSDAPQPVTDHQARSRSEDASDAALIGRSVGEPDCFARLFDRHASAIYRYVARQPLADVIW
jgi:hypothetical protein